MESKVSRNKVVNSLWWKMLERIFSQGINLIVQIILARLLLPADFGSLAIIVAITNYAAIFVQSGLGIAIIQKNNLQKSDIDTLFTASLSIALFFYIILFLSATWIADYYDAPGLKWPLRVQSLVLFLNAINSIQTALLARSLSFKTLFLRSIIAVPVAGAVGIIMAYNGFGLWSLVAHNLTNMLVVVIVMTIGSKEHLRLGFNLKSAKQLYSFSGKILLTSLVSGAGDTIRTMVIGKRYSRDDLSYYDKANTYSNYVTQIVIGTIQSVILPVLSRSQDDIGTLKKMARRSIGTSAFIMFPVLLWVSSAAKPLVLLLLTAKWEPCIPYLMLFCVLRMCGCVSSVDKQVYYALGRSELGLFYEIIFLVINIIVLLFTVNMGIIYIVIGFLLTEFLGTISLFCLSSKIYNYSLLERWKDLSLPIMNSTIMFVVCWGITFLNLGNIITLSIQLMIGPSTYLLLSKLTKDDNLPYLKETLVSVIKNK